MRFDRYSHTIQDLLARMEAGTIRTPRWHREGDAWTGGMKRDLLYSVHRGIPIGPISFRVAEDGTWELIDGLQRLCALRDAGDAEIGDELVDVTIYESSDEEAEQVYFWVNSPRRARRWTLVPQGEQEEPADAS
jgi:hypothetical protein